MEPKFHDLLSVTEYRSKRWFLNSDLRYTTMVLGYPWKIIVPQHFPTDLASIPRAAQAIIPVVDKHRKAAVVHDWLTFRNPYRDRLGIDNIKRQIADRIFYEAMLVDGVDRWKAATMYCAVSAYTRFGKRG